MATVAPTSTVPTTTTLTLVNSSSTAKAGQSTILSTTSLLANITSFSTSSLSTSNSSSNSSSSSFSATLSSSLAPTPGSGPDDSSSTSNSASSMNHDAMMTSPGLTPQGPSLLNTFIPLIIAGSVFFLMVVAFIACGINYKLQRLNRTKPKKNTSEVYNSVFGGKAPDDPWTVPSLEDTAGGGGTTKSLSDFVAASSIVNAGAGMVFGGIIGPAITSASVVESDVAAAGSTTRSYARKYVPLPSPPKTAGGQSTSESSSEEPSQLTPTYASRTHLSAAGRKTPYPGNFTTIYAASVANYPGASEIGSITNTNNYTAGSTLVNSPSMMMMASPRPINTSVMMTAPRKMSSTTAAGVSPQHAKLPSPRRPTNTQAGTFAVTSPPPPPLQQETVVYVDSSRNLSKAPKFLSNYTVASTTTHTGGSSYQDATLSSTNTNTFSWPSRLSSSITPSELVMLTSPQIHNAIPVAVPNMASKTNAPVVTRKLHRDRDRSKPTPSTYSVTSSFSPVVEYTFSDAIPAVAPPPPTVTSYKKSALKKPSIASINSNNNNSQVSWYPSDTAADPMPDLEVATQYKQRQQRGFGNTNTPHEHGKYSGSESMTSSMPRTLSSNIHTSESDSALGTSFHNNNNKNNNTTNSGGGRRMKRSSSLSQLNSLHASVMTDGTKSFATSLSFAWTDDTDGGEEFNVNQLVKVYRKYT